MARLTEKHIQKKAIHFLEKHYQEKFRPTVIYSRQEVRTVEKYKKKRADGLLCFESQFQKEHTVSLEAKSHKTLGALLPVWNNKDLILSAVVGIIFALISSYLLSYFEWYWITLISLSVFIGGFLLSAFILVLFEPDHFKSMAVIDQIHQYPANEKWIAISKDSLNLTSKKSSEFNRRSNPENFMRIARKKGVGILVISRRKEEVLLEPQFIHGEYLNCYCQAEKARQVVYSMNEQTIRTYV